MTLLYIGVTSIWEQTWMCHLFTKNTFTKNTSNDLIIYWGNFYMGADMDVTFVY